MGDVTIHVIYLKTDLRSSNSWKAELEENKVRRLPESMFDQSKVSLLFKRYNSLRKQSWNIAWDRFSMESWKKNTPSNMLFSWSMIYMQNQKSHTQTPYSKNCCTRTKPWQNNSSTIFGPPKKNDCNKTPVLYFFQNTQVQRRSCFAGESYFVSIFHFPTSFDTTEMVSDSLVRGRRGFWLESWLKKSEAMEKYQCVHHVL